MADFNERLDDFLEEGQTRRNDIINNELGIEVCPYVYDDNGLERFGLFKPYSTESIQELAIDATLQTIVNPIATTLSNLYLSFASAYTVAVQLYEAAQFALGIKRQRKETPLLIAADEFLAIGYFLIHAVVDPLWEIIAAVTRTLSTIGLGLFNGATAIVSALESNDTTAPSPRSQTGDFSYI